MDKYFFMDYAFKDRVSGFQCNCSGTKNYTPTSYESVDNCIDDALKILKKFDSSITFNVYFGYQTINLLRMYQEENGIMTMVYWKRNKYGGTAETHKEERVKINRANLKKYILLAIEFFNCEEAA